MPKQNRVDPFGHMIATPARGTFMGNRGILHDADGRIQRAWQCKRWLVCVLEFRGRKREVMSPGHYTELFFLDEATALAAGHRPCAECRHRRFLDFCQAWKAAHSPKSATSRPTADEIDQRLHAKRLAPDGAKLTHVANLDDLPDGVFVTVAAWGEQPFLVKGTQLLLWSPDGYGEWRKRPKGKEVTVLTPPSTVRAIRAGYMPEIQTPAVGIG
jgi:hypothetical protein